LVGPLLHSLPGGPGPDRDPVAVPEPGSAPELGAETGAGRTAVPRGTGTLPSVPGPRTTPEPPRVPRPRRAPGALLLDQGGVIARSTATPDAQRDFARSLAVRLDRAGYAATTDTVLALVLSGRDRYRAWKATHPE